MATECVNRFWARSIGESITCEAFKITKQILYFLIQSTAMNTHLYTFLSACTSALRTSRVECAGQGSAGLVDDEVVVVASRDLEGFVVGVNPLADACR